MSMDGISGQPQDRGSLGGTMDEKTHDVYAQTVLDCVNNNFRF